MRKGSPMWLAVVFFFVGFCPGMWIPGLPSVLRLGGHEAWIPWIYMGMPIGSIISPLFLGALSDGKVAANRLCGYVMLIGGCSMTVAFGALHFGAPIELFVGLMITNALLSAPLWALVTQSALSYLRGKEEKFCYYRVFGTVGWVGAGMVGGFFLGADTSATAGLVGGLLRFPAGLFCFLMPHCEPAAKGKGFSFLQMLGSGSKELWLDRNTRTLFISAGLIAIPLSAFFMYVPLQMETLGIERPTVWMTLSQWFEIPAMLTLVWACAKFRIKWLVFFGLAVSALRQVLLALSAETGQLWLLALGLLTHGLTFTYFLTVAQVYMEKRVDPSLRGRAQGMLSLMFGGLGSLIGVFVVSQLFDQQVDLLTESGWGSYWWGLSLIAVAPCLYFLFQYQKGEAK